MSMNPVEADDLHRLRVGAGRDVLSACQLLRTQWPFTFNGPQMPFIALVHQLYFLLNDRTLVDRELATLQRSNRIRVFKLFAQEGHELCIVLTTDYIASIKSLLPNELIIMDDEDEMKEPTENLTRKSANALPRPSSLPTPRSPTAATASISSKQQPVKSQSAVSSATTATASTLRFDPWPSANRQSTTSAKLPTAAATSSLPPRTNMTRKPSSSLSAANSNPVNDGQPIKRKRSNPTIPSSTIASSSTTSTVTASAASSTVDLSSQSINDESITKKQKRVHSSDLSTSIQSTSGPPTSTRVASLPTAASSPPDSSLLPDGPIGSNTATGGVNPKLHIPLSDCINDDRFPALTNAVNISKFSSRDAGVLIGLFITKLIPNYTDISITQEKLLSLIYQPYRSRFESMTGEQCISCLLHLGMLLFKTSSSFFFAPPGISRLIGSVRSGRKDVIGLIRRRQYHEVPLTELLKVQTLKTSPCRIEFHLREMLGSEELIEMQPTTIGTLIKLVRTGK